MVNDTVSSCSRPRTFCPKVPCTFARMPVFFFFFFVKEAQQKCYINIYYFCQHENSDSSIENSAWNRGSRKLSEKSSPVYPRETRMISGTPRIPRDVQATPRHHRYVYVQRRPAEVVPQADIYRGEQTVPDLPRAFLVTTVFSSWSTSIDL